MPLVRINLRKSRTAEAKAAIADAIQASLVNVLGIPNDDRFVTCSVFSNHSFL